MNPLRWLLFLPLALTATAGVIIILEYVLTGFVAGLNIRDPAALPVLKWVFGEMVPAIVGGATFILVAAWIGPLEPRKISRCIAASSTILILAWAGVLWNASDPLSAMTLLSVVVGIGVATALLHTQSESNRSGTATMEGATDAALVVECSACGVLNRLTRRRNDKGVFRCNRCKTEIVNPFDLSVRASVQQFFNKWKLPARSWLHRYFLYILWTCVALAGVLIFAASPRKHPQYHPPIDVSRISQVSEIPPTGPIRDLSTVVALNPPPPSGHIFLNRMPSGRNELHVDNGTNSDALVKLVHQGHAVCLFYIRTRESFTLTSIGDGTYGVEYAMGRNFQSSDRRFSEPHSFGRFASWFDFDRYGRYHITLHAVPQGEARTTTLGAEDFYRTLD